MDKTVNMILFLGYLIKIAIAHIWYYKICLNNKPKGERSGSVVERLTQDRRAVGSSLTGVTVLWSLSKTHLS